MNSFEQQRKNFRIHVLDGALYISSGAFLSAQTVYPALLTRLGAGNLAIGALPVIVYLFFFLPQIVAANHISRHAFRKPWVQGFGSVQRLHVAALAILIVTLGNSTSPIVLPLFFALFISNQVMAGMASPAWFDFAIKTTAVGRRGVLMGLRTSLGSVIGFVNGLILAYLLAATPYPWSYGLAIGIGFLYQTASLIAQHHIVEIEPSPMRPAVPWAVLLRRIREILKRDRVFVRFLVSASFQVLGFAGVAFFTVAALKKFSLPESVIGVFTILTIGAQILSAAVLGWFADRYGNKVALLASAVSLLAALVIATFAQTVVWFYAVFIATGVNLGAELMARYNFTAECAGEEDRALYIGLMNAWCAPWYLGSLAGGWVSDQFGYAVLFAGCAVSALVGILLLARMPNPHRARLALSSK